MELFLRFLNYFLFALFGFSSLFLILGLIKPIVIKKIFRLKKKINRGKVLLIFGSIFAITLYLGIRIIQIRENIIPQIATVNLPKLGKVYAFGYAKTDSGYNILAYKTNHKIVNFTSIPDKNDPVTAIEYYSNNKKLYIARHSGIQYIDLDNSEYKLETWINIKEDTNVDILQIGSPSSAFDLWIGDMYIVDDVLYYTKSGPTNLVNNKISLSETELSKSVVIDEGTIEAIQSKNDIWSIGSWETYTTGERPGGSFNDNIIKLYAHNLRTGKVVLLSNNSHEHLLLGNNVYYVNKGISKIFKFNLTTGRSQSIYDIDDKGSKDINIYVNNLGNNLIKVIWIDKNNIENVNSEIINLNGKVLSLTTEDLAGNKITQPENLGDIKYIHK